MEQEIQAQREEIQDLNSSKMLQQEENEKLKLEIQEIHAQGLRKLDELKRDFGKEKKDLLESRMELKEQILLKEEEVKEKSKENLDLKETLHVLQEENSELKVQEEKKNTLISILESRIKVNISS